VSSFIHNNKWRVQADLDPAITQRFNRVSLPILPLPDRSVWCASKDGDLSAKKAYEFLFTNYQKLPWTKWLWRISIPPSNSFVVWRCFHNKMPTDENLIKRGCVVVSVCVLCFYL
jgi:hypothetical protein